MRTSIKKAAYLFCLSLTIVCGCSNDNSVPGKIDISLEEIQQKIVGTWQQDAAELEVEIRANPEMQRILSNEQAKAVFEENLKCSLQELMCLKHLATIARMRKRTLPVARRQVSGELYPNPTPINFGFNYPKTTLNRVGRTQLSTF